jgi:dienelactone hydrolase/protocatechuate 3,4-dioxygenase beta subunit
MHCLARPVAAQEAPRQTDSSTPAKLQEMDGPDGLAGMPAQLDYKDTSPGFTEAGQKLLLTGVILKPGGRTPASGVVLYYYHTNHEGKYIHRPDVPRSMPPNELGQTHGYLRGWLRTGADGKYAIYTVMPAPYPNDRIPAHIHATIKEPDKREYYIDDFVFDSDPLVDEAYRSKAENRCGNGIMHLERKDDLLIGQRNIILGQNIPDHRKQPDSGGDDPAALSVPATVPDGANPGIVATGLVPDEVVRIHVLRSMDKWTDQSGTWKPERQSLHAWADFKADDDGSVQVGAQSPLRGTSTSADPLALLRSGYRFGVPELKDIQSFPQEPLASGPESRVWVKLERNGSIVSETAFELITEAEGLTIGEMKGDGWHAVYAFPASSEKLPLVLSLHGSEGGSVGKARGRACLLASHGFAAVAVNYFAYSHEAIEGVPSRHEEIRLEILESIREWLETRPEVNVNRIHLTGVSKGAEFAMLAATHFDWIASVVALVPSDVVWEGYSAGGGTGTASSSWSIGGKPVPFIPLFPFDPKMQGMYRTNTERYERSRQYYPQQAFAARIPVEKIDARILLLASDRDEVWASGAMARNIVERMIAAGNGDRVEVKIYPKAGHQIAGTGTFPVRLYGEQSPEPDARDILAEGDAAADSWRRTMQFLNSVKD